MLLVCGPERRTVPTVIKYSLTVKFMYGFFFVFFSQNYFTAQPPAAPMAGPRCWALRYSINPARSLSPLASHFS